MLYQRQARIGRFRAVVRGSVLRAGASVQVREASHRVVPGLRGAGCFVMLEVIGLSELTMTQR